MDPFSEVMSSWGIEGKNKFVIYVAEKSDMMPRNQQDSWPRVESKHGHEVKYFRKRPLLCQSPSIYDILPCLVMMKISSIRHSEVLTFDSSRSNLLGTRKYYGDIRTEVYESHKIKLVVARIWLLVITWATTLRPWLSQPCLSRHWKSPRKLNSFPGRLRIYRPGMTMSTMQFSEWSAVFRGNLFQKTILNPEKVWNKSSDNVCESNWQDLVR